MLEDASTQLRVSVHNPYKYQIIFAIDPDVDNIVGLYVHGRRTFNSIKTKHQLGIKSRDRRALKVVAAEIVYQPRDSKAVYLSDFGPENDDIGPKTTCF